MKQKKQQLYEFVCMIALLFALYITHSVDSTILGIVLLVGYLGLLGLWWRRILVRVYRFEQHGWVSYLYGLALSICLLGFVEAVPLALYTTTWLISFSVFVCVGIGSFAIQYIVQHSRKGPKLDDKGVKQAFTVFPRRQWSIYLYGVLAFVAMNFFVRAEGTGVLTSPWQAIDSAALWIMFAMTILLGVLVASQTKTKIVLFLIIVHSIVLHLYIPLSHQLPWGGDVWRHIGVESRMAEGDILPPVLFGEEAKWREALGADLPEAFLIPQKYTYGQFWSLAIITHQVTGIDFKTINIWLMPFLWSLIFPLLLFRIGRLLFSSWRGGLLLAWLSFFVFPLQALGALTLPVSLGVLTFFFFLMLWLQYLHSGSALQRNIALAFGVLMFFGYTLAFLLTWLVVFATSVLKFTDNIRRTPWVRYLLIVLIFLCGILAFPFLEILSGISMLPASYDLLALGTSIQTAFGQFFGYYYASAIRPHDMLSGNIVFNHTPIAAFVSSAFTVWRWWAPAFMVILWTGVLYTLFMVMKKKVNSRILLPVWLFVSLMGAYKIGWFFLEGDRLFTRRLDPFLITVILFFFSYALTCSAWKLKRLKKHVRRIAVGVVIVLFSWVGVGTYASGPDMRVLSVDEYAAGTFVMETIESKRIAFSDTCVLASTWGLFPIEAQTQGYLVGGGFPLGYQFGQQERVRLHDAFLYQDVTGEMVNELFLVSETTHCFVVLPDESISEEKEDAISTLVDRKPVRESGFLIWEVEKGRLKL